MGPLLSLLLQLGEYAAALADYEAALALDPGSSYALYNAGIVRDRLGDYAGAVAAFSGAIQLEPQNADFFHNRGFSYRKMERYEDAIADYTLALQVGGWGVGVAGFCCSGAELVHALCTGGHVSDC